MINWCLLSVTKQAKANEACESLPTAYLELEPAPGEEEYGLEHLIRFGEKFVPLSQ